MTTRDSAADALCAAWAPRTTGIRPMCASASTRGRQPCSRRSFQRVLRDDDTFVVDIGPVWDGYEGDYGDTFVTGATTDAHLRGMGASHNWHPTYVRFGVDTQSPAVQPTDFQRVLRDDDTFVVDIGPVWDGYEGDYGDTFVTGRDDAGARCARAREVFRRTRLDDGRRDRRGAVRPRRRLCPRIRLRAGARDPRPPRLGFSSRPCTASTSWRTPTSRRRRHLGAGDPGARPDAAGRRLL